MESTEGLRSPLTDSSPVLPYAAKGVGVTGATDLYKSRDLHTFLCVSISTRVNLASHGKSVKATFAV